MIHVSNKNIYKLKQIKQVQGAVNPNGLLYTTKEEAKMREGIYGINYKYKYEMELRYTKFKKPKKNRVLKIKKNETFDQFCIKYGFVYNGILLINWVQVAEEFGGIEVIPYLYQRAIIRDKETIDKYCKSGLIQYDPMIDNIGIMTWLYSMDEGFGRVWNYHAIDYMDNI